MTEVIKDMEEQPLKGADGKVMMLKDVCINALLTPLEEDKTMSGQKKADLFMLAMSIKKDECELTVDDVSLIKTRVGKMYSQLVVGRVFSIIEG